MWGGIWGHMAAIAAAIAVGAAAVAVICLAAKET